MANKIHVKTDDNVIVITGKDSGKTGKVIKAVPSTGRVVVSGVNIVKKHQKGQGQNKPAAIIEREAALDASNVMLVCPKCAKPTRVGTEIAADKTKSRVCKKCGAKIDKLEKAKAEKTKVEKPKAEKPKAEKPKAEKPKAEKPKAEKPKAAKPKAEKADKEGKGE